MMTDEGRKYAPGKFGKYTCTRCGWKWTPRDGSPDPPRACARCRTAYWQTPPRSSRANSPEDPKWQAERDLVPRRRRLRHLAKLKELAVEFRLEPPPVEDRRAIPLGNDLPRPAAAWMDLGDRFNDRGSTLPASSQPVGPLSGELTRLRAQESPKPGMPSAPPVSESSTDSPALARRREVGYGKSRDPRNL
jgi:hypothetical protein